MYEEREDKYTVLPDTLIESYVEVDSGGILRRQPITITKQSREPKHSMNATKKSYECYLCHDPIRTYTQFHNLVKHMRYHTTARSNRKVFQCTKCDMQFNQVAYLWRHISSTHADVECVQMHQCNICGKKVHPNSAELHMRVHNGSRPFKCDICGSMFSSESNLKSHMWQHSDHLQYQCNLCERSFIRIGRLRDHLRIHSNEKPFQCAICDVSFTNSYRLTTHNKEVHANEATSILFYDLKTGQVLN